MKIIKIFPAILIIVLLHGIRVYAQNNQIKTFSFSGTIRDDSTKQPLPLAKVTLVGSDGTIEIESTDFLGKYKFDSLKVHANTAYEIRVEKEKYFGAKQKESTIGLESSKDIIRDFNLTPWEPHGDPFPEIKFDDGQWELLPQHKLDLNEMVKLMQDNPNILIEIISHTDTQGSLEYDDTLSFKRAKAVVDYIISKGIEGERLQPKGCGQRIPRTLYRETTINGFVFPKGAVLTDAYTDQFEDNKEKFEAANQLNNIVEFRILRTDYDPKTIDTNKENSIIIEIKQDDQTLMDSINYKECIKKIKKLYGQDTECTGPLAIIEIEKKHTVEINNNGKKEKLPFGYLNEDWNKLKTKMMPGDKTFEFKTGPESWHQLSGRKGIIVMRGNKVVGEIITKMN